jgi:hypothetical protein
LVPLQPDSSKTLCDVAIGQALLASCCYNKYRKVLLRSGKSHQIAGDTVYTSVYSNKSGFKRAP